MKRYIEIKSNGDSVDGLWVLRPKKSGTYVLYVCGLEFLFGYGHDDDNEWTCILSCDIRDALCFSKGEILAIGLLADQTLHDKYDCVPLRKAMEVDDYE